MMAEDKQPDIPRWPYGHHTEHDLVESAKCWRCQHSAHLRGACARDDCLCGADLREVGPVSTESAPSSTTGNDVDPAGVNHPEHYNLHPSGVECIDVVRHHNFNIGSAIKYLWRQGLKDGEPSVKDLSKAIWYIEDEIKRLEQLATPGEGDHS